MNSPAKARNDDVGPALLRERTERVDWLLVQLKALPSTQEIEVQAAAAFGCSRRMVRKYIRAARLKMRLDFEANREEIQHEFWAAVRDTYRRAIVNNDGSTQIKALHEIGMLFGIYAPTRNIHQVGGMDEGRPVDLPPEKARQRLAYLMAKSPELKELAKEAEATPEKPAGLPPAEPEAKEDSDGNG